MQTERQRSERDRTMKTDDIRAEVYRSETNDPFFNLAFEDKLFERVDAADPESPDIIFYLWQNANTVVIGKSQNAWREARNDALEADGGTLVRRTSGGGAVFHDMGNLCYTFIARTGLYDLTRQLSVILDAVKGFGIDAEFTGRNDIVAGGGRKFSGNAFRFSKNTGLMHGTLLIDTDGEKMAKYLNVSPAKMNAKGITSVRSRVVNLIELAPGLTAGKASAALTEAFCRQYGIPPAEPFAVNKTIIAVNAGEDQYIELAGVTPDPGWCNDFFKYYQRFSSWEWRFGQTLPFDISLEKKFGWGLVRIEMEINNGTISRATVSTDAMDADLGEVFSAGLSGVRLDATGVRNAVQASAAILKSRNTMISDPEIIVNDMCALLSEI